MIYNYKRREFYITYDDVVNNSEFNESDLADKLGEQYTNVIEKDLSRLLNRYLYGSYKGTQPLKHRDYLNAYVLSNSFAQTKLRDAFIEVVKGAMYGGLDLLAYRADAKKPLPESVTDELLMGKLWITGEKVGVFDYEFPTNDVDLGV